MKKEKSCGAIVYKIENNELYFLLLKHNAGHWSFAKGHVEERENEEQTAIREIKEETNLDVVLDTSFRTVHTYSPKEGILKDVILFLATCKDDHYSIEKENHEIKKILWLKAEEALQTITYEEDKKILKQAIEYIHKKVSISF